MYSEWIVNNGHLAKDSSFISSTHVFWKSSIDDEVQYPVSSILISELELVSSVPLQYTMFIPIAGIANIIYLVLAKYILTGITKNKSYALFLSSLFYLYTVSATLHANTSGRAVLGLTFFTFFLYIYLRFSQGSQQGNYSTSPIWSTTSLLLIGLVVGNTYYFATLDILALMLLIVATTVFSKRSLPRKRMYLELSILILAVFLFFGKPLILEKLETTNITYFFSNIVQYVSTMLGRLGLHLDWINTAPTKWAVELTTFDPISVLGQRISFITQYSGIIAILACLVAFRPRNGARTSNDRVWLFCLFLLFCTFGEFGYFTAGPAGAERLLLLFGPIVTLYLVLVFSQKSLKFNWIKKIVTLLVILLLCLSIWGEFRYSWNYGSASGRPFAYDYTNPVAEFLCAHSTAANPITLTGDEYFASNIFFISSIHNKTDSVIPEPLVDDTIYLHDALVTGNTSSFLLAMNARHINYLFIVDDGKPFYGDGWGYIIQAPSADKTVNLNFSLVFNDGRTQLLKLSPG